MAISEKNLLTECLKGNPDAQKALYEKYKVPLFRVCLRYAKDRPEAEDMLQDGFVKIFTDLHQYNGNGAFGGWLRRVVVNVALQHIRKYKKFENTVELDQLPEVPYTNEIATSNLNAQALTKMIQQLPTGYRTVFNLYVVEGYTHQEIAELIGVNINTSKSQLSKAKASLRALIRSMENTNIRV